MEIMRGLDTLIDLALEEDLAVEGDITSKAIFDAGHAIDAEIFSKESGILAGIEIIERVFERIDPSLKIGRLLEDGCRLSAGSRVFTVQGSAVSIFAGERISLNFLSYLSGIASRAYDFIEIAKRNGRTVILDTRKTLPGYRYLAKYAVVCGGAKNHRMGLYDMIMIKDRHIDGSGSIRNAMERVRREYGGRYRIEIECRTAEEVREAVECGADVIMLDNINPDEMKSILDRRPCNIQFEISGNVTLDSIGDLSRLGADFISVGSLTHSVRSHDFSLKVIGINAYL